MKEKVIEHLGALGFMLENHEDICFQFEFEGLTMLYLYEEEAPDCLWLAVPGVFEVNDENRDAANAKMVKLCELVRYVQPTVTQDDVVSINYQHCMAGTEPTEELLEHMIRSLAFATRRFQMLTEE